MKNTKFKRIAAAIACVLVLIVSLVVPAFCDDVQPMADAASNIDSCYTAFIDHLPGRMRVPSFSAYNDMVLTGYQLNGDSVDSAKINYFRNVWFLASGLVDIYRSYYPLGTDIGSFSASDTNMFLSMVIDGDVYNCFNNRVIVNYTSDLFEGILSGQAEISIDLTDPNGAPNGLNLLIRPWQGIENGEQIGEVQSIVLRRYDSSAFDGFTQVKVYYDDEAHDISLTIGEATNGEDFGVAQFLSFIFFGRYPVGASSTVVYHASPLSFYNGFMRGYSDGAEVAPPSGSTEYDRGYADALYEINSGQFGKNLLGGVLSAPFDFFREFTLVEWELANGLDVEITLATVVSAAIGVCLFVWFLKLFAGG